MTVRWSQKEKEAISAEAERTGMSEPGVVRTATRDYLGLAVMRFDLGDDDDDSAPN